MGGALLDILINVGVGWVGVVWVMEIWGMDLDRAGLRHVVCQALNMGGSELLGAHTLVRAIELAPRCVQAGHVKLLAGRRTCWSHPCCSYWICGQDCSLGASVLVKGQTLAVVPGPWKMLGQLAWWGDSLGC